MVRPLSRDDMLPGTPDVATLVAFGLQDDETRRIVPR
jgi:hypothetical protein